jgi:hypothetical protein
MGVHQLSLFESFEMKGTRLYKVGEPAPQIDPPTGEVRIVGDACRQCNRYENSDGMFGGHCDNCDCCKEKEG